MRPPWGMELTAMSQGYWDSRVRARSGAAHERSSYVQQGNRIDT
ncbi:hypothetical protein HMPREF1549_01630 [Actinomyces johnsonii F0510]|uniref:Uncharacterized protein n=1 Tax=Actinomyces johnsonii F0510 TaxID=1227262 RepID=U1Q9K2_9ACTO|nr:hypothetical protein HMPREF1549_01630 [Actinomyces johnsonii F0510]